jgi:hypothetical protein
MFPSNMFVLLPLDFSVLDNIHSILAIRSKIIPTPSTHAYCLFWSLS